MPKRIQVGPYSIEVASRPDPVGSRGKVVFATADLEAFTITLDAKSSLRRHKADLLHEALHFIWYVVGLSDAENINEDVVVSAFAPTLLDTMRRNPHLMRYLLAPEDES